MVDMKIEDWVFKNIHDYWDQNKDAIFNYSSEIDKFEKTDKEKIFLTIKTVIEKYSEKFSDEEIASHAVAMTDYLYKAANRETITWGKTTSRYIYASAGTLCRVLSQRGFSIHYLVDNTYEQTEWGMTRPLKIYELFFNAADFIYICPQRIALELMKIDTLEKYFGLLPKYIQNARRLTKILTNKCQEEKKHYILLDTDSEPETFKDAEAAEATPLTITIFRNEPPVKGTNVKIHCLNREGRSFFVKIRNI